jgi:hypothetical protein
VNASDRPIPALQDRSYERAGSARERTLAEDVGCARGPAVRLRIFSVSAASPPKSVASFTISPTGSPATCATCDLRHSADLKNVPHPINAPNLTKKRRLEEWPLDAAGAACRGQHGAARVPARPVAPRVSVVLNPRSGRLDPSDRRRNPRANPRGQTTEGSPRGIP